MHELVSNTIGMLSVKEKRNVKSYGESNPELLVPRIQIPKCIRTNLEAAMLAVTSHPSDPTMVSQCFLNFKPPDQ